MAYKKKSVKSKSRRKVVVKKVYKKRAPAFSNSLQRPICDLGRGFPKMIKMEHIYSDNVNIFSTGGTAYYTFSCNSLYDPNVTLIGGHQPLWRDEMQAIYDHSCCIGSKIDVMITPIAASYNTVPISVDLFQHDAATPVYPDPVTTIEQHNSNYKLIAAGQNNIIRLSSKWSAKKEFGRGVLSNNQLQGDSTNSPAEQTYYSISIRPTDNITTVSVQCIVKISYIVIWKELKNVSQS